MRANTDPRATPPPEGRVVSETMPGNQSIPPEQVQPLGARILVRQYKRTKSAGGIHLIDGSDAASLYLNHCLVLKVGDGKSTMGGEPVEMPRPCEPGDLVFLDADFVNMSRMGTARPRAYRSTDEYDEFLVRFQAIEAIYHPAGEESGESHTEGKA